jgi:hypothetical protein
LRPRLGYGRRGRRLSVGRTFREFWPAGERTWAVLLGGTAFLLGVRSFGHRRGSVPLSTLPVEDRIADAVKERLDVLVPSQVIDVGGHFMQARCQLAEVGAQSRNRCAFVQRRPQNPAPQLSAGRWSTVPEDDPVTPLPHPIDRVPVLGHTAMVNLAACL